MGRNDERDEGNETTNNRDVDALSSHQSTIDELPGPTKTDAAQLTGHDEQLEKDAEARNDPEVAEEDKRGEPVSRVPHANDPVELRR